MPRSARDSDEEVETRVGRRTRNLSSLSVQDSPLRRSTRFKPAAKSHESSPDSPLSDSNTLQTRSTRKRATTMDTVIVPENGRRLRPRKNSVSPNDSENPDSELTNTPSYRSRRSINTVPSAETPKSSTRTRRLTRAGSEAKSPPTTTRIIRSTRSSSMGPETTSSNKLTEKIQTENKGTVKSRRRASVVPSESTVTEEKEEIKANVKDKQEHILSEILEINEEGKISRIRETEERPEELVQVSEGAKELAKGQPSLTETVLSGDHQNSKDDIVLSAEESELLDEKESNENSEKQISDRATQNIPQNLAESTSDDGSKDFELRIENASNESTEEPNSDTSNKENKTANVITDVEQNADNTRTTLTLQSPKSFPRVVLNKLDKEKPVSPLWESMKNANTKETLRIGPDVTVADKSTMGNMDDIQSSLTDGVESTKRQSTSKTVHSSLLIDNKLEETTAAENCELSASDKNDEKLTENTGNMQNVENNMQQETAAKEIIDGIEITDVTDIETTECEEIDVEAAEVVEETDLITLDEPNEATTDEPMDVSILEVREIFSDGCVAETEIPAEDDGEGKSIKVGNTDNETETAEDAESPSNWKTTDLPSNNKAKESEVVIIKSVDVTETSKEMLPEIVASDHESERISSDTAATHALNAIEHDMDVNKNNDCLNDVVNSSQSSTVTESQVEPISNSEEQEEVSKEISLSRNLSPAIQESTNEMESTKNDEKITKEDDKEHENEETVNASEVDSDADTECLFQDIPASQWKNKKYINSDSENSVATEKIENESEAECDLVLVDREAWLAAENLRAAKEKEMSDYDSDDTVVLKSRIDSMKDRINRNTPLEAVIEESDEDELPNSLKKKSLQNKRKSTTNGTAGEAEVGAQIDENIVPDDSSRKSAGRKSLSKSLTMNEMQETHNTPSKNANLNKSDILDVSSRKKRKSLNKSIHNVSLQDNTSNKYMQDLEIETEPESLSVKKKSLNKSETREDNDNTPVKPLNVSSTTKKNASSLNNSLTEKKNLDRSTSKKFQIVESEESSVEETVNEIPSSLKKTSSKKKASRKHYTTVAYTDSESDESNMDSDSDDSKNKTVELPKFLFAESDSDTENETDKSVEGSIDSDIRREYNLDGKDISKFDDDNVPGDECRASESEYSDPDDNGSDLDDFVVDDDEVEEEEEENEEEIEDKNSEDHEQSAEEIENEEIDKATEEASSEDHDDDSKEEEEPNADEIGNDGEEKDIDDEGKEEEEEEEEEEEAEAEAELEPPPLSKLEKSNLEKSTDSTIVRSAKKKRLSQTSIIHIEGDGSKDTNDSERKFKKTQDKEDTELAQKLDESGLLLSRVASLNRSMECSTPKNPLKMQEKFHTSFNTPNEMHQQHKKSNKSSTIEVLSSIFSKNDAKASTLKTETPLRKISKTKKLEKLLHKSLPTELIDLPQKTNLSRVTSSNVIELNKAVATPKPEVLLKDYQMNQIVDTGGDIIKTKKKKKAIRTIIDDDTQEEPPEAEELAVSEEITCKKRDKKLKVLAKAEALQKSHAELKQLKQKKKRKRETKKGESEIPQESNTESADIPQIPKKWNLIDPILDDKFEEFTDNTAKKKTKKKKRKVSNGLETEVIPDEVSNKISIDQDTETDNQKIPDKVKKKKDKIKMKSAPMITPEIESGATDDNVRLSKKNKATRDLSPVSKQTSVEKPRKKRKLNEGSSKFQVPKKSRESNNSTAHSNDMPETITSLKTQEEALEAARLTAENIKMNKKMKRKKQKEHVEPVKSEKEAKTDKTQPKSRTIKAIESEGQKKGIKRLPEDVLENLTDIPRGQPKKRKISKKEEEILPSRKMSNATLMEANIQVDKSFIPLSLSGSTTQFAVVNLEKIKKPPRKSAAVASFREKMLARNSRQPVSAYMIYLEKQKASGKSKKF